MASTTSFLDLPVEVRGRIYQLAGLVRSCSVDLRVEGSTTSMRKETAWLRTEVRNTTWTCRWRRVQLEGLRSIGRYHRECICDELPVSLLYVSKEMHNDALRFLYKYNRFKISYHPQTHLQQLRRLNTTAVAWLNVLCIRLTYLPCIHGDEDDDLEDRCLTCIPPSADACSRLSSGTLSGQMILHDWRDCCTHMSRALTPGQLRLSLVCDTDGLRSAKEVVGALEMLPRLKALSIRLGQTPDRELITLAQHTALKMTCGTSIVKSSNLSFDQLPMEIRLHILNYTHLGAKGGYHPRYSVLRIQDNRISYAQDDQDFSGPPTCCGLCTDVLEPCCCPWRCAAVSSTCVCRRLPTALFQVSKQMCSEANFVIFSNNKLEFRQEPTLTLEFIRQLHPALRRSIRRIRLKIPVEHIRRWEMDPLPLSEWEDLIIFIKNNLQVASLRLTFDATEHINLCYLADDDEREIMYIYRAYKRMINILSRLGGLQAFRAQLPWFRDYERIAEKQVMGLQYIRDKKDSDHVWMRRASRGWRSSIGWAIPDDYIL